MRRLLFLNNQGLGAVGGGVGILRALVADLAGDHAITIVSDDRPAGAAVTEVALPPFDPPRDARWRIKPWLKARHVARTLNPSLIGDADIVVAMDPHFAPALAAARPRRLVMLSLSCTTRQEWFGSPGATAWWYAAQYAMLERRLARQARAIIVASAMHAREMQRFAGCRGRPLPVFNPVFPVDRPVAGARDGAELVAIGRVTPVKNLAALVPLLKRLPGLRLALLGDGGDPAALRRLAEAEGVADRIAWVGAVRDPTPWLDGARLLLHPSRYESFGMVVHEAMRRGTVPVVFAPGPGRMSAAAELATHDRDGLHVDYDDPAAAASAIRGLLSAPDRLQTLSRAARETAAARDRFDYRAAFRDLLARVGAAA
jgi:glycosyltransferase involved in cell wall biosynthesis